MLKSLWRTHSCVPRSHSCERWPSRLAYPWRSMLLVTIEHKCLKMFAHEKTKWHCALLRAVLAIVPTSVRN
jgi:hypothetical protein